MEWLKNNWIFLIALVSVSAAWGRNEVKVQTLEDAIKSQSEINRSQREINKQLNDTATDFQKQNGIIDERTKLMLEMLKDIKQQTK